MKCCAMSLKSSAVVCAILITTSFHAYGHTLDMEQPQTELPEESGPVRPKSGPGDLPVPPAAREEVPEDRQLESPSEAPPAPVTRRPVLEQLRKIESRILNRQAADQGSSSTQFVGRIQIAGEIRERPSTAGETRANFRVDQPLGDRGLIRVDARYHDREQLNGQTDLTGLGDISARIGYRLLERDEFQLFAGTEVIFPTASPGGLGDGKFTLGPGVAISIPLPEIRSVLFPVLQHYQSVGGDPSRERVSYSQLELEINTPWGSHWWTNVLPTWRVDWEQNAKSAMLLDGEIGRKFGPHYRAWLRGGSTLWGSGVSGTYNWMVQFGIRYMF